MSPVLTQEMTTEDIAVVIGAMAVAVIILWIILAIAIGVIKARNNAQPLRTARAIVVEKQALPADAILSISRMWIMFETEDGMRLRLNAKALNTLCVGDVGRLTWQGNEILRFDREVGTGE